MSNELKIKIQDYRKKHPELKYLNDIELKYHMEYWNKRQRKCKHVKSVYTDNTLCVLCGIQL